MSVCLSAYTADTPHAGYPAYISVNQHDNTVEVTVRSTVRSDGRCGDSGLISLSLEDFRAVFTEALMNSP